MKLKAALVLMLLVLTSLLSFSNRCGQKCDGRTIITSAAVTATAKATVSTNCAINEDRKAGNIELAERSAFLRMTIVL